MTNQFLGFKKGNVFLDTMTFIIILIVFGLFCFIGYKIFTDFNNDIQSDPDISDVAKAKMAVMQSNYPSLMDYLFLTVLILFWIAVIVSSFLIDTHPVFFILSIFLLIIVLIVGAELSNSYEELVTENGDVFIIAQFPIIHWVLSHLVAVIITIAMSIVIALYAKNRGGFA